MATTSERISIVETKVENINEKIDSLNVNVREMHDCLDKTREDLTNQLEKMYNASCEQHAALGKEISELKKIKDKWIWMFAGGITVIAFIVSDMEKFIKFFS